MRPKRFATHVTTADGHRVYVSASSRSDLDRKISALRLEIGAGINIADASTVGQFSELWLTTYKSGLRADSRATLESNLRLHVLPVLGDLLIREVRPLHIQTWLTTIRPYSASVQRKCIQIVRSIFDAAAHNGLILRSPVSKEDRPITLDPEDAADETSRDLALTDAQATRLLDAVQGTRAYLFCLLGLSTGLRRSELLGLMWSDVDLEKQIIRVRHSKVLPAGANDAPVTALLKSAAAYRTVPIPDPLLRVLRQERERTASLYVLSTEDGRSLTRSSFASLWACVTARTASDTRPLGATVGGSHSGPVRVSLDFHTHPHQLRHTYVTRLFEAGLDVTEVQYLAGHATPEITMRVYTHYRKQMRLRGTLDKARTAAGGLTDAPVLIEHQTA